MWCASVVCLQVMFSQQGVAAVLDDDDDGGVRSKRYELLRQSLEGSSCASEWLFFHSSHAGEPATLT